MSEEIRERVEREKVEGTGYATECAREQIHLLKESYDMIFGTAKSMTRKMYVDYLQDWYHKILGYPAGPIRHREIDWEEVADTVYEIIR